MKAVATTMTAAAAVAKMTASLQEKQKPLAFDVKKMVKPQYIDF